MCRSPPAILRATTPSALRAGCLLLHIAVGFTRPLRSGLFHLLHFIASDHGVRPDYKTTTGKAVGSYNIIHSSCSGRGRLHPQRKTEIYAGHLLSYRFSHVPPVRVSFHLSSLHWLVNETPDPTTVNRRQHQHVGAAITFQ